MPKMINLNDFLGKLLYYKSPYDLKSTMHPKLELPVLFYVYIPAKVHFILKVASKRIVSGARELAAVHNVIIGTQAKYMIQSLNC